MTYKNLPVKPEVSFSDLDKIDIRIGTIKKVTDITNSDKLVKLSVDFGDFKRNIIVGLKKERANVYEIEGKLALFVVNLAAKIIMGEKSDGMIFDIGYNNGIVPVLAIPEMPVPNGSCAG